MNRSRTRTISNWVSEKELFPTTGGSRQTVVKNLKSRVSTAKTNSSRFKSFKDNKRRFDPAATEDGDDKSSGCAFLRAGVHSSQPDT